MYGIFAMLAAASTPSQLPITVEGMLCHPTRLMVKVKNNDSYLILKRSGFNVIKEFPEIKWAVVETAANTLQGTKAKLHQNSTVENVTYDRAAAPAYTPNDPMWPNMWHAANVRLGEALDLSFGSNKIVVAIMDTGVFTGHNDLKNNLWVNPNDRSGDGIDNDNNGYIDDRYGWDFSNNDNIPNDVHGHGTACAGLASATMDNGIGGCGTGPRSRIMALKASTDDGWFYDSNNVPAYLYAANKGANIISGSFFSDRVSQSEEDALDYCLSKNVLPIIAAGNANTKIPYYPGAYEQVLGVAATVGSNEKASFSNYGSWVDVAAPGVSLVTTTNNGGYTSGFAGTSGACPVVAGVAALVWGARPSLTALQVRAIIEDTSIAVSNDFANYGRIDAKSAVQAALNQTWVGKPTVVRYANPIVRKTAGPIRIYGRGLQEGRSVQARISGVALPILSRSRDWMDVQAPAGNARLDIYVDSVLTKSYNRSQVGFNSYSLIDPVVNNGGVMTGGFDETQNFDSKYLTVTRGGNSINLQGTFRRVQPTGNSMTLRIVRGFLGTGATEKISLYNWSTASYPYGSFDTIHQGSAPTARTDSTFTINNFSNYIDPDGTVIVMIEGLNASASAKLNLDLLQVRD